MSLVSLVSLVSLSLSLVSFTLTPTHLISTQVDQNDIVFVLVLSVFGVSSVPVPVFSVFYVNAHTFDINSS
jgi:hypothetical protein